MQQFFDIASDLNVEIEYTPLNRNDGEYRHDLKLIRLREGMTTRLTRFVLAHEIAHAIYGDTPHRNKHINAKQERRADEWAALQLIDADAYRETEHLRNGHIESMAHDLGVVTRTIIAYQRTLLRVDGYVYQKPKLGTGQWKTKVSA